MITHQTAIGEISDIIAATRNQAAKFQYFTVKKHRFRTLSTFMEPILKMAFARKRFLNVNDGIRNQFCK